MSQELQIQPHMTVTCCTHSDEDGLFSGMLVHRKYPQTRIYQLNYGKEFDEAKLGDYTFVTDFSFDSLDTLYRISTKTHMVWIDHHMIIRNAAEKNFNPIGLRRTDCSAAKLTWEYLYPGEPCPLAIQYVSDYDTWEWDKNLKALYFHYGLGMMDLRPNDRKSEKMFEQILTDNDYVDRICLIGQKIDNYIKAHNKIVVDDGAFETEIDGIKAVACNCKNTNSLLFDSINHKYKDYPLRMLFSYFANIKRYRVSIFSLDTEKYPACDVCTKFGGGGHVGAAGFTTDKLPFKTPTTYGKVDYNNIYMPLMQSTLEDPLVRRYSNMGNIPLIWSHQYPAVLGGYSSVVVNHPSASVDAFYSTGLNNSYSLGVFAFMTKSGYYRYRIYLLDPRLKIDTVCTNLNKNFDKEHTPFTIVGNSIWTYVKQMPDPVYSDQIKF